MTTVLDKIDLAALPSLPDPNWKIANHVGSGELEWGLRSVDLDVVNGHLPGSDFARIISSREPLNANVHAFLLANQNKIPSDWIGHTVVFPGTIFVDQDGNQYVCFMRKDAVLGRWIPGTTLLNSGLGGGCAIAFQNKDGQQAS